MFKQIQLEIDKGDKLAKSISKATVYWHLDHLLKVYNGVSDLLLKSDEAFYQPKFSFLGWWFMTFKYLPKGKGKAPKGTYTEDKITLEDLKLQFNLAHKNLDLIQKANSNSFFSHPYFGHFNTVKTLKFLKIHTNHHLKIIKDIRKAI